MWLSDWDWLHSCRHASRLANPCSAQCVRVCAHTIRVCGLYLTHSIRCTQSSPRNNQLSAGISSELQQLQRSLTAIDVWLCWRGLPGCRLERQWHRTARWWKECFRLGLCKKKCWFWGPELALSSCIALICVYNLSTTFFSFPSLCVWMCVSLYK